MSSYRTVLIGGPRDPEPEPEIRHVLTEEDGWVVIGVVGIVSVLLSVESNSAKPLCLPFVLIMLMLVSETVSKKGGG